MDLTEDDVLEIMKLFERSKFDYLQLEHGGRKITLVKGGYAPIAVPAATPALLAERAPPEQRSAQIRPLPAKAEPTAATAAGAVVDEGLTAVTAPMVGKFYAAPSPSDPPYVQVGTKVEIGATVGLIEVMKVFASIKTETAGMIERILVATASSSSSASRCSCSGRRVRTRALPWTDVHFVDTTIRDGHQSLWAERMTTGMMLPIAKNLNDAGFDGIELISGSHLKKGRARTAGRPVGAHQAHDAQLITNTPLRLIAGPRQHLRLRSALACIGSSSSAWPPTASGRRASPSRGTNCKAGSSA